MKTFWKRFWKDTEGQDLVEYALLVAAIALGMVATIHTIAQALSAVYTNIQSALGSF
jgi:Flp pilus assembly pilin Flp